MRIKAIEGLYFNRFCKPTLPDKSYAYDALGNRLTSAAVTGNWSYNLNNELLGFASTSFHHDDNGNMTSKTVNWGTSINK